MSQVTYHVIESSTPDGLQSIVNERLSRSDAKWELVGGVSFCHALLENSKIELEGSIDGCCIAVTGKSSENNTPIYTRIFAQAMTMTTLD